MGVIFSKEIYLENGGTLFFDLDDTYSANEDYMSLIENNNTYHWRAWNSYETGGAISIYWSTHDDADARACLVFNENDNSLNGNQLYMLTNKVNNSLAFSFENYGTVSGCYMSFYTNTAIARFNYSTNIPVFDNVSDANDYLNNGGVAIKKALNYKAPETSPDGDELTITNMYTYGEWISDTQPPVSLIQFQNFRGKMTGGEFALYPISGIDDNRLKMGIKNNATFEYMQYSTDGNTWTDTDTFPFEYFYRRRVNELGSFYYALTFQNSKIPIFEDEQTAQDYLDGNVSITKATNWGDISSNYPPQLVTGDEDENTTMGQVYTRAFFSQQYICDTNAIQQISNALFDISTPSIHGLWDDIKKGIEMFGDNPIDAVQSCMFFPVNLRSIITNVQNQGYIYFGGYQFNLQDGVTVDKIVYPNAEYNAGSFDIGFQWGNTYRDYSPYSRLFCYLPYIGWTELDIARYIGKHVTVKYYFDTRTGGCLACLFVSTDNGICLLDYFNGQCGVSMPLTMTNFSDFMNSQLQILLGGGSKGFEQIGTSANALGELANVGASLGTMASIGSVGALGIGLTGAKTVYGLTQNNINNYNKTKGASSSMLNQYLPQYVMFLVETQDAMITPNELSLQGYPSNASGLIMEFSGYLEVDTVNLVCDTATENERVEIINQLKSGVYLTNQ